MADKLLQLGASALVKLVHPDDGRCGVNKVHRVPPARMLKCDDPLEAAKVAVGEALEDAIGLDAYKRYGSKSLMSGVCSGEKVPNYLAAIYAHEPARVRLALSLLTGTHHVKVQLRVVVELEPGHSLVVDIEEK